MSLIKKFMGLLDTNNVLVIACHPDDEVLGVGGTILKLVEEGKNVYVCVVTEAVKSLGFSKEEGSKRRVEALEANKKLGVKKTFFLDMPSVHLDAVPVFKIISKLREVIKEVNPSVVFTHYQDDPNQDHKIVSEASLVATNPNNSNVKEIYFYEVPSSTTYTTGEKRFSPNSFVDIGKHIVKKMDILGVYQSEIKEYPHARSKSGVKIYAQFRGMECKKDFAEAFLLYRGIK